MQLRLCIAIILFGDPDLVSLVATECSSFIHMNCGTSKRSQAMPDGDPMVASVWRSNGLAARTCLLLLLMCLLCMTWVLEQPGSSVLMRTKRMQWLVETVKPYQVIYLQSFWMACWGHDNPKRTCLWSCNPAIRVFTTDKIAFAKCTGLPTAPPLCFCQNREGWIYRDKVSQKNWVPQIAHRGLAFAYIHSCNWNEIKHILISNQGITRWSLPRKWSRWFPPLPTLQRTSKSSLRPGSRNKI